MKGCYQMKTQQVHIGKVMTLVIAGLCLLLIYPLSAPRADRDSADSLEPGQKEVSLTREKVTIVKKDSTMIVTRTGERFKIREASLIVGLNGEQLLFPYLLVPCEASLVYRKETDGTRTIHRIEVLKIHENATNQMEGTPQ